MQVFVHPRWEEEMCSSASADLSYVLRLLSLAVWMLLGGNSMHIAVRVGKLIK